MLVLECPHLVFKGPPNSNIPEFHGAHMHPEPFLIL